MVQLLHLSLGWTFFGNIHKFYPYYLIFFSFILSKLYYAPQYHIWYYLSNLWPILTLLWLIVYGIYFLLYNSDFILLVSYNSTCTKYHYTENCSGSCYPTMNCSSHNSLVYLYNFSHLCLVVVGYMKFTILVWVLFLQLILM